MTEGEKILALLLGAGVAGVLLWKFAVAPPPPPKLGAEVTEIRID